LPYTVDFENDGTAAAQDVTVTEQLDPSLDWSTFQLGSFGFGPVNITIPAGLTQYQTNVSYQNSDGSSLNVQVALDFNVQTGLLTVTYTSLDPLTGQAPSGVFDGFLYPESQSAVNSDGFVQYTVGLNAGLTTGTAIHQQASVVFDTNAPLDTAPADNTIDASVPKSTVAALPAVQNSSSFPVTWSGHDNAEGSGVAFYDVYVSDNGGAFTPFLTGATATSATYYGFPGHTYGFYSLATSNVGTVQATPSAAQATTAVAADASAPFAVLASGVLTVNGTAGNDTIALTTSGSNLIATLDGASSPPFAISSITSINVNGNAGADLITLGAGVPGSSVQGGPGADTIFGGSGADTLGGGKGKDSITAGSGNDLIHGGAGADTIVGGTGDETLFGGLGADVITGGSGDDQINGGAGTNQMHAGTGTDAFYAENGTADQIFAGSATNDTLFYSASDNYVIESGAIPPGNITLVS
jgi:Ca2+-binding RTX toxin-like protein